MIVKNIEGTDRNLPALCTRVLHLSDDSDHSMYVGGVKCGEPSPSGPIGYNLGSRPEKCSPKKQRHVGLGRRTGSRERTSSALYVRTALGLQR